MTSPLDHLYRAVEAGDLTALTDALAADAFVLTPEADGILMGRDAAVAFARDRLSSPVRIEVVGSVHGENVATDGAWVFDQLDVEVGPDGDVVRERVRVTALLARDADRWRIASCYWSLSFGTQAEQDAVKAAGELAPGRALEEAVTDEASHLATSLAAALEEPGVLPDLYSTRDDHVSVGSVVDEVFVGSAGRDVWRQFVGVVSSFVLRGPVRGALATDDLGWLAANIDIGEPPTPYRFFYVWLREPDGWRIVVSHDSVSRALRQSLRSRSS